MSEKEKKIIRDLADKLPTMTERERGYLEGTIATAAAMSTLARKAAVSVAAIMSWIKGSHKPMEQSRKNICAALGKDENFLTPKRKRNVRE